MPEDIISLVLPALLIGLIGLVVGAVAGYLLAGLPEADSKEPQRPKNLAEAARLWRDKRSGKWVIEIDGQLIKEPGDLNTRQREALQRAQVELHQWVGGNIQPERVPAQPQAAPASPPGAPIPPTIPIVPSSSAAAANPTPVKPVGPPASRLKPADDLPLSILLQPPVEPVSVDLPGIIAKPLFTDKGKEAGKEPAPPKSIAGQVDDILQERLPASHFRERVIRVQDSPQMGIQVIIDGEIYEGVGDVPYADVQQFIRECVAEWERRSVK